MKEIKFRVWDKVRKRMYNVCELYLDLMGNVLKAGIWLPEDEHRGVFGSVNVGDDKFEIIQFTGLKDKNGKEIYEGDIIQYLNKKGDKFYKQGDAIVVQFKKKKFQYGWNLTEVKKTFREVIGNKFENQELLK